MIRQHKIYTKNYSWEDVIFNWGKNSKEIYIMRYLYCLKS